MAIARWSSFSNEPVLPADKPCKKKRQKKSLTAFAKQKLLAMTVCLASVFSTGLKARSDFARNPNSGGHQLFVYIHITFVFGQVAFAMRLVEYPPLLSGQIESVLETLEHEVP